MPPFTSLVIPALYQSSRQLTPRSLALIRQIQQLSTKAGKPDIVTYEEIDTLIQSKNKVSLVGTRSRFKSPGERGKGPMELVDHAMLILPALLSNDV